MLGVLLAANFYPGLATFKEAAEMISLYIQIQVYCFLF
jgi:hypothetical protein